MSLFKNMLSANESLFLEPIALDFDYQPKLVPYRENQQQHIASCIKPLFQKRNGKNLIITGTPGIGKTVCLKHVLRELEQETDEIHCIYINCWKKETPFKIITEICTQINYTWTHNKGHDELVKAVTDIINKKSAVIVLDEADKITDQSIIYTLLEDLFRKTIILITNTGNFISRLDPRIKSRLMPDTIEFKPYNYSETKGILKQRINYAFVSNIIDNEAFEIIVKKTHKAQDIRHGLFLLKESGDIAESKSSRIITQDHVNLALEKSEKFRSKKINLESDDILNLIKQNKNKSITELYEIYRSEGGSKSYRTFHRRLKELESIKLIEISEANKGFKGRTFNVKSVKTLDEY